MQNNHSTQVGTRLAQAMMLRGVSKRGLAQAIGTTEHTVARMVRGQKRMDIDRLVEAMHHLELEPSVLFDGSRIL